MRKEIVIGLGAALATFAVGATEASAGCKWERRPCRSYRPPPVYNYAPPPPAYGYGPTVQIFAYAPPAHHSPPAAYYPSAPYAYGPSPYSYGASYYRPPAYYGNGYDEYNGYYGNGHRAYGYAPRPHYDSYRPVGVWVQIR
jgi:hypothetical protein